MTDSIGQRPGGDSAGDLVARFISAFNFRDLDTMLETLDPEVDFHPLRMLGVEHSYRGHSGVEEWFRSGLDPRARRSACPAPESGSCTGATASTAALSSAS